MVDLDDAGRIDQNIASQLVHVGGRQLEASAANQELQIHPPGRWSPYVPPVSVSHPVGPVQIERPIQQDRPPQTGVADIRVHRWSAFKRHHSDADAKRIQLVIVRSQLRQVFTTRQSAQMPVEYQQQPMAGVIFDAVHLAGHVG